MIYGERILNELKLFSNEENIEYNLDKFDSGENNILYITGLSGGGKSTYAQQIIDSAANCSIISIDILTVALCWGIDRVKLKADPLIVEYYNLIPNDIKEKYYGSKIAWKDEEIASYTPDFLNWVEQEIRTNHKSQKYIIEGIQLILVESEFFKNKSFVIIQTSVVNSSIRALKRDFKFNWQQFKKIFDRFKFNSNYRKIINKMRDEL